MNLLNLLPSVKTILDKFITSPTERAEVEAKLKELDIRELEAKYDAQKAWMSNGSLFVSGSIPALLWMLVLVIFFNYILSPILQGFFEITIPLLTLPEWYSSLCSTIILGLFAKKSWDSSDITIGKFSKKSKYESESDITNKNIERLEKRNRERIEETICDYNNNEEDSNIDINEEVIKEIENDKKELDNTNIQSSKSIKKSNNEKKDINDPEYVNKRYEELLKEYDIK